MNTPAMVATLRSLFMVVFGLVEGGRRVLIFLAPDGRALVVPEVGESSTSDARWRQRMFRSVRRRGAVDAPAARG